MSNMYNIDINTIKTFTEHFSDIYKDFMDFGGIIYNDAEKSVRVKKLFYACAICHNMNWDFLCKIVVPKLYEITNGFNFFDVCNLDELSFEELFADYPKKNKIEAPVRLEMLRKLSRYICDNPNNIFDKILHIKSIEGTNGLSNIINNLPVFKDDPLHKKGNLLIQILLREGLVTVYDEYNVEPSIDYHVIRFFLRNGFIGFDNNTIIKRLATGDTFKLEEITEIRRIISDCMKYICTHHNISIAKLGYIAWSVGRNYCRNDYINCEHENTCPMIKSCKGYVDLTYRELREPESNVGFY